MMFLCSSVLKQYSYLNSVLLHVVSAIHFNLLKCINFFTLSCVTPNVVFVLLSTVKALFQTFHYFKEFCIHLFRLCMFRLAHGVQSSNFWHLSSVFHTHLESFLSFISWFTSVTSVKSNLDSNSFIILSIQFNVPTSNKTIHTDLPLTGWMFQLCSFHQTFY